MYQQLVTTRPGRISNLPGTQAAVMAHRTDDAHKLSRQHSGPAVPKQRGGRRAIKSMRLTNSIESAFNQILRDFDTIADQLAVREADLPATHDGAGAHR